MNTDSMAALRVVATYRFSSRDSSFLLQLKKRELELQSNRWTVSCWMSVTETETRTAGMLL